MINDEDLTLSIDLVFKVVKYVAQISRNRQKFCYSKIFSLRLQKCYILTWK